MLKEQGGQLIFGGRTSGSAHDALFWGFNGADGSCVLDFCNLGSGRLAKTNVYDAFVGKKILARDGAMLRGFFDIYGNGLVSGGVELVDSTPATASFDCGVNCGLFTASGQVWSAPNFNGRIYSFSVTHLGEPFLTLVPCIEDATGEVGFYDAVGRRFVRKTTEAGAFTAGPPVRCVKSGLVFALY